MQTIISPLLPSIVKVLQKEERSLSQSPIDAASIVATQENKVSGEEAVPVATKLEETKVPTHPTTTIGAFILIGILTGLFVIVGIGTSTLFKSEPVAVKEQVDPTKFLDEALGPFAPGVKYSFNKSTGRLLLVGHVLTATDKNQLLYTLQGMKYIKNLDDSGIVIDEYVWREINQVLEKNPNWKGISVQSPSAGHFVLSGYLQTRAQSARLDEYMSNNFPYIDLLEKRIVVDEVITGAVSALLDNMEFRDIKVKLDNGSITLSGKIPVGKSADVDALLAEIKNVPGVRSVRNLLAEVAPEQSMINISDKYEVTGSSNQGGSNLNVVINGRILMKGDVLDGMTITSIQTNTILLEKEGIKFRIDFSK
ncbi:MAG: type III secretion system inner membrane ring subunit SctD [Parachlamydiaceae bacterium]|nr:type III secretion system inner membrane ring subunit SctD [Parachlamydiaceae bacterium]